MSFREQNQDNNEDIISVSSYQEEIISKSERIAKIKQQYDPLSKGFCYNPFTKQPYPFLVNSKAAKDAKLFTVMYSTGRDKEPLKYYFDNKEQYERYCVSKKRRR